MGDQEKTERKESQVKCRQGPSNTPVVCVLGLVIIIKPITLADFALVGFGLLGGGVNDTDICRERGS